MKNYSLFPCWSVLEFWKIKLENSSWTSWIFAGYTGSKNSVWNRLKIQFVELDFSKLIFQKSIHKYRSTGGWGSPPFGPDFINFSKTVSYEVNLALWCSQCSHLEIVKLGHSTVFDVHCPLTGLTWLNHTSVLPSKWNLYPKKQFLA